METAAPTPRNLEATVDARFPSRWSPRAFDPAPLKEADLASVFEAARWAPSRFNEQPWLFVYGATDADGSSTAARDAVAGVIMEGNRVWSDRAPVLGVVFAKRTFAANDNPNRWAGFDSGAAAMSLALQAGELGLVCHFMGGFDAEAAAEALGVDGEAYEAIAAFAIGQQGATANLPEALQEREAPSPRKPLAEVARLAVPGGGRA